MKKKTSKREKLNLLFSAFLILAYIVCGYFFVQFAESLGGDIAKAAVTAAILVIFGLLVFYATRVGERKTVRRFSIFTLVLLDLPALYIIVASVFAAVPLHEQLENAPIVVYMAAMAFGYGVPYTFISGFEAGEQETVEEKEAPYVLEGGVEADLGDADEIPAEEEPADEVVVEGVAADEQPMDAYEDAPEEAEEE